MMFLLFAMCESLRVVVNVRV